MKFTPEVVAALKVLRNNAESDFERHRLDVLERDLTAPPTIEQVDENHQRFNGVTYTKDCNGHYRVTANVHRDIWEYYNGEIPDGYHIHHVDEDKNNNAVENLQCLSKSEHQALHMQTSDRHEKRKRLFICQHCGREYVGYESGNNAFCSKQCRDESSLETRTCTVCGKSFKARRWEKTKYCSPQCASQARRKDKTKICVGCGKTFNARRHFGAQKYCSFECYVKSKGRKNHQDYCEERVCVICGNRFSVYKYDKSQTCSPSCGAKLAWQHRHKS